MGLDEDVARISKKTHNQFMEIEEEFQQATNLLNEIKGDLQEAEMIEKKAVGQDGVIRVRAEVGGELERDVNEIESDIQELSMLISEINEKTQNFAELVGVWDGVVDELTPE